ISLRMEGDLPTLEEEFDLAVPAAAANAGVGATALSAPIDTENPNSSFSSSSSGINLYSSTSISSIAIDRESILNCSKETAMLLQIVIGDLETDSPLDEIFLSELK